MYKNNINEKTRGTVANILNHYYSNGSEVPKEVLATLILKRSSLKGWKFLNTNMLII